MSRKNIILSYDYELFFGDKSGTIRKSVIEPTNLLLDAMDCYGLKGSFFVDWQMLKYTKLQNDNQSQVDYQIISEQIKDIVRRGHRVELHIHPHWVDARYIGSGEWDFSNFNHYSLNSFTESEIIEMFKEGVDTLHDIIREVDPKYQIIAFRAGGWAVQPFTAIKKGFLNAGIKVDSSVAYGAFEKNQYSQYDFRIIKTQNPEKYLFNDNVCEEDESGLFLEVPIASYKRNVGYKIIDKLYRMMTQNCRKITDGTHSRKDLKSERDHTYSMVTMSRISPITTLLSCFSQKTDLITIIDHPKDFTYSVNTSLKYLSKIYKSITYKDLCV